MNKQVHKIAGIIMLALSLMGNKGCKKQKPPADPPRQLKYRADVGTVTASKINLPGGGQFDFAFVANAQLYNALNASKSFSLVYNNPTVSSASVMSSDNMTAMSVDSNGDMLAFDLSSNAVSIPSSVSCLIFEPQVRVGGSVNSFEAVSDSGISIGFNPHGIFDVTGLPSLSVGIQKADLNLSLIAYNPLSNTAWATATEDSTQTTRKIGATINFGNFQFGPQYYYQTPLSAVVDGALHAGADSLASQLYAQYGWFSRVMSLHDSYITIVGGKNLGMQVGDQLAIYNENHNWEGAPCSSKYLGSTPTSQTPVAVIQITNLGDDLADGFIIQHSDDTVDVGARAVVYHLLQKGEAVPALPAPH